MSTAPGAIGGAYGAGKAGAPFDPLSYIKKPQVILRLVSLVSKVCPFKFFSLPFNWIINRSESTAPRRPATVKSEINTTLMSFLCFIMKEVGVFLLWICLINEWSIIPKVDNLSSRTAIEI